MRVIFEQSMEQDLKKEVLNSSIFHYNFNFALLYVETVIPRPYNSPSDIGNFLYIQKSSRQ